MAVINDAYFDTLVERINAIDRPAQLQTVIDSALPSLQLQSEQITASIAQLAPFLALATGPAASPSAIVTWISSFIAASIQPQVQAYNMQVGQLSALGAQIARVTAAIEAAQERIGSNIEIPTIP